MKRIISMLIILQQFSFAQSQSLLSISTQKTTSMVFPFPIVHVDMGSSAILAQPVKESPSILLVKAAANSFPETNLSVVTQDGSLYAFVVCYDNNPLQTIYRLPVQQSATVTTYANAIADNPGTVHGIRDRNWDVTTAITGIYIKDAVMYYQLKIMNNTSVDYDIDVIRFFIADKKKGKRTAVQENELKPLHTSGNVSQVKAYGNTTVVIAIDKFTIPDAKYLAVQIMEKNGGRHLSMKMTNKKIMHAIILPDLK